MASNLMITAPLVPHPAVPRKKRKAGRRFSTRFATEMIMASSSK